LKDQHKKQIDNPNKSKHYLWVPDGSEEEVDTAERMNRRRRRSSRYTATKNRRGWEAPDGGLEDEDTTALCIADEGQDGGDQLRQSSDRERNEEEIFRVWKRDGLVW